MKRINFGGEHHELKPMSEDAQRPVEPVVMPDDAPENNLPDWIECSLRVDNTEFIGKRIADGGYGFEEEGLYANELHRFIYEYDDADPYRSAWFLHRLEKLIEFIREECRNEA